MACEYKDQWAMASAMSYHPDTFPWSLFARMTPPINPPLYGPPYITFVRILNRFGHKLPETVSSWYVQNKEESLEIREVCDLIDVCENHKRLNHNRSPDEKVAIALLEVLEIRDWIWTCVSGKAPVEQAKDSNGYQW